jgi:hypothetical protein
VLLASEAGMQSYLPIRQQHLTKKFGRTAFCRRLKKGAGRTWSQFFMTVPSRILVDE